MKIANIFFILFILTSCSFISKNGIRVEILNGTDLPVTNVKFYTSEELAFLTFSSLKANENVTGFLSMTKNKFDGSYVLEFQRSEGKKEYLSNGYYTNGGSLDEKVQITIKNDSAIWDFKIKEY